MSGRRIDERKATQVAAFFLRKAGGHIHDYIKLAKLVYYADRTALIILGRTITKGKHYSLQDGPVVSEVNDMLSRSAYIGRYKSDGYWDEHIVCTRPDGIRLVRDPGTDMLGDSEVDVLERVQSEHGWKPTQQIKDECHGLPEYEKPTMDRGRKAISYSHILRGEGVDKDVAGRISRENERRDYIRGLLTPAK